MANSDMTHSNQLVTQASLSAGNRWLLWTAVLFFFFSSPGDTDASVRTVHRELRRMVGYTILAADSVSEVLSSRRGDKYVKLHSGLTFRVELMLLEPLVLSDVIIFAKPLSEAIVRQYPSLPEHLRFQYKLLIDDEIYDATPIS